MASWEEEHNTTGDGKFCRYRVCTFVEANYARRSKANYVAPRTHNCRGTAHLPKSFVRSAVAVSAAALPCLATG